MELDPDLLTLPFAVETNWQVITGAPSSGKTTVIDLLAERGYETVPESARRYMEEEIVSGRSIEEIHGHGAALQRALVDVQRRTESGLRAEDLVFLDGAVPGSLAWFRLFGLDPNELLADCFQHRYASVFVLDPLPLELDGLRFGNEAHIRFIDEWTDRDYRTLGYRVTRVPVMAPEERLAFVLECLPELRADTNRVGSPG